MGSFAVGVLPFALVLGVVAVLMLLEPHLSGTVLILCIGAVLMFVGGTGLRWFVLAGVGGAAAIGAASAIMPDLVPYAASRLSSWLDPFADPLGDGHQTIQSLYAIGSGGAAGLGLGSSRQKHLFVPEPQNDFIFSILCEELGFVGACGVILLFALLLWRGVTLAAHRHQPAVFLLRRHQPDDAAGRNGHRAVGVPRGDVKPDVPRLKTARSGPGTATNDTTNKTQAAEQIETNCPRSA